MEVIKNNFEPGRFEPIPSRKIRCKHCKSKLKITYDDLKKHYDVNGFAVEYYFECKCCKATSYISLEKGKKHNRPNAIMQTNIMYNPKH